MKTWKLGDRNLISYQRYSMKVAKANPENCLMLTYLKLKTLVVMIDCLYNGEKDFNKF